MAFLKYKIWWTFKECLATILMLTAMGLILAGVGIIVWDLTGDCAIPYWIGIIMFFGGFVVAIIGKRLFGSYWGA